MDYAHNIRPLALLFASNLPQHRLVCYAGLEELKLQWGVWLQLNRHCDDWTNCYDMSANLFWYSCVSEKKIESFGNFNIQK